MTLKEKLNNYQNALDALLKLDSDKYRKAIRDLRNDIATIKLEAAVAGELKEKEND